MARRQEGRGMEEKADKRKERARMRIVMKGRVQIQMYHQHHSDLSVQPGGQ